MKKKVAVIGSTGSVGKQALDVIEHLGWEVVFLVAGSNLSLLKEQTEKYPKASVGILNKSVFKEAQPLFSTLVPSIVWGMEDVCSFIKSMQADIVISACRGVEGVLPTFAAIASKKDVALANKESLVVAGELLLKEAKKTGAQILPVDSEHSALFQLLQGKKKEQVAQLILTASGGPFLHHSVEELKKVTLEEALSHPTWSMGSHITVGSSLLLNKGLEVIEAHLLFDIPYEKIEVLVHPQSLVHGMVAMDDGTLFAHLSAPDMRNPIQYALTYPEYLPGKAKALDFKRLKNLHFIPPDSRRFRCLDLAINAGKEKGSVPAFFNAASEALISRFLAKEISWFDIAQKLEKLLGEHQKVSLNSLEDVRLCLKEAQERAFLS